MSGIFISYRRDDSPGHAGRLFDNLKEKFGREHVFMDVSGIEPGTDFVEAIEQQIGSCEVLIVVVGKRWLDCTDSSGRRRLDDPHDFIRLETATALRRNIRVIPVLVQSAPMPRAEELPEDLQKFARRQAVAISDTAWDSDVGHLIQVLEKTLGPVVPPEPQDKTEPTVKPVHLWTKEKRNRVLLLSLTALIVLSAGAVALFYYNRSASAVFVPDVVGLMREEATNRLKAVGLEAGDERRRESNKTPGSVLSQNPAAGNKTYRTSKVELVIAQGVKVPDVVGKSTDEAKKILDSAGLEIGRADQIHKPDAQPGTIFRQSPEANTEVQRKSQVNIEIVAKPVEEKPAPMPLVTVPAVIGMARAQAVQRLRDAGLQVGDIEPRTSNSQPDTVIHQNPAPGKKIAPGGSITLIVARAEKQQAPAPKKEEITVPAGPEVRLKFSNFFPASHQNSNVAVEWCREVEKRTNGRIKIDYSPGAKLVSPGGTYDAVVQGTIDIGETFFSHSMVKFPLAEVSLLPLGYRSALIATRMMNEYYRKFQPKELADVKVLFLHGMGPTMLFSTRSVEKMDEIKGMKIIGAGPVARVVQALGGAPVQMVTPQAHDALSRKVVDGILCPFDAMNAYKLAEVVESVTESYSCALSSGVFVVMNKQKWDSLPAEVQRVVEQINREWIDKQGRVWDQMDEAGRTALRNAGKRGVKLTNDEEARWARAMTPVLDAYVKNTEDKGLPGKAVLQFCLSYVRSN